MSNKKRLRNIAGFILIFYIIMNAVPTQQLAYSKSLTYMQLKQEEKAKEEVDKAVSKPKDIPATVGNFQEKILQDINEMIEAVNVKDVDSLKNKNEDIKTIMMEVKSDFQEEAEKNKVILNKIDNEKAKEKQAVYEEEFSNNINELELRFNEVESVINKGDITEDLCKKLNDIKNNICPEKEEVPIGTLNHDNVNLPEKEPALGTEGTAAYINEGRNKDLESSLSKEPNDADLQETKDIQVTEKIKSIADKYESAVGIYEYVRNNISFEAYYGSRKGSKGTILEKSGNDFDQASLLIAMLRYKNIPARYVRGVINLSIEDAKGYTGAETTEAAVKALCVAGIPTTQITEGGKVTKVLIEHTWVEAYVPYENYRGIGEGTGQSIWVPLDPSYKKLVKKEGINLEEVTGVKPLNTDDILDNIGMISKDEYGISRVETSIVNEKITTQTNSIESYAKQNIDKFRGKTPADLTGGYDIAEENLQLLPCTLPYETENIYGEYEEISEEFRDKVAFSIKGSNPFGFDFGGEEDFNYSAYAVDLYGKKITLSWVGDTEKDEEVLKKYGGVFKTPAYLVDLKPVLNIDGEKVAEGKTVGMGYKQEFKMDFKVPGQEALETVANTVTAGSYYCVGLDYGAVSSDELTDITNKLKASNTLGKDKYYTDLVMGNILNSLIKMYFSELDYTDKIIQNKSSVRAVRFLSEGMTGYNAKVSYNFMVPVKVSEGSFFIDIDRNTVAAVSLKGNNEDTKSYMVVSGMESSSLEHEIFEQTFSVPSVSTIKILDEANKTGVPIYHIDSYNINEILPKLYVDESTKKAVKNAVNSGKEVTIPQRNIQYNNWTGCGYIVVNSETGAAAYMISGGYSGGSMTLGEMFYEYIMTVLDGLLISVGLKLIALTGPLGADIALIAAAFLIAAVMIEAVCLLYNYYLTGDDIYLQKFLILIASILTFSVIGKGLGFGDSKANLDGYSKKGKPDFKTSLKDRGFDDNSIDRAGSKLNKEQLSSAERIMKNHPEFTQEDFNRVTDDISKISDPKDMEAYEKSVDENSNNGMDPKDYKDNDYKPIETEQGGCFTRDTLVLTKEGLKRIDEIKAGDLILSKDTESGQVTFKKVLNVYEKCSKSFVEVTIDGQVIKATPNHPFMLADGQWINAGELKAGDKVATSDGDIKEVECCNNEDYDIYKVVYNLNIEDNHTYYVSNLAILVHNGGCGQRTQEIELPRESSHDNARNTLLKELDKTGAFNNGSRPYIGRLKISYGYGKQIGRESLDGKVRWRLDYDENKGVHYNIEDFSKGKGDKAEKKCIPIDISYEEYKAIIDSWN